MSDGHCFISYTNAKTEVEAIQLATKLADRLKGEPPNIDVWIDNRSIHAGNWDEQVSEAIKTCKCVLFIVSPDSVTSNSICADEVDWAIRYKKIVIPIIAYKNAEVPFRLSRRKFIDFTGDFEIALSQLRNHIGWLDTPEGILQSYKDRLADAQRDLRRNPESTTRIEAEIEELTAQIRVYEKVAENPEAAKKQTEQNIQNGLERERKPQLPIASFQSSKFINQPPGVAQNYFQDRLMETEQAILFLKNEAQRVLTVVGRGGAGKTAMVCRLLKFVENGGLPDDFERKHGRVDVDGIVYLSEAGSRKVNFANLFEDLCKLLPAASAEKLSALYREPQTSTESKTVQLLAAFQGLKQVIVLLDNFENVVDAEKGQVRDAELDEALRAILHAPHHPVKIIITTRVSARELDTFEPARQRLLPLDTGLQPEYAREAFVLMDEGNLVGIKNAGVDLLNLAVTRTLGLPRALEALYAALRTDRFTTLQELLDLPILPEQVVQAYVGEAFNRLDTNAQKVMQALAVYNRPVTPAAVDYLLAPHIPAIDSAPILQRLANMHFARKESGRFYLHPVDREFAFGLIPEKDLTTKDTKVTKEEVKVSKVPDVSDVIKVKPDDMIPASETDEESMRKAKQAVDELKALFADMKKKEASAFTQHDLTSRAADYFRQARKPRAEWKKLDDLAAQLAEFDLRCAAGDYDTAASVLLEIDFDYLLLWGHYRLMIELNERLQNKLNDTNLKRVNFGHLGIAYRQIGIAKEAIGHFESALSMAREAKNRRAEGAWLDNLGASYAVLGNIHKAIKLHEEALIIDREFGDHRGEGADLGNLGSCYADLGEEKKAIDFYEKVLVISREINDRYVEGIVLENIGLALLNLRVFQNAAEKFQRSIQIAEELFDPAMQLEARWGLAQAYLLQNDLVFARATIEAALGYDVPDKNHNASALHGIIALRQGEEVAARGAFVRAIGQADEILSKTAEYYSALDAKGLAICGLVLCDGRGDPSRSTEATDKSGRVALTDAAAGRGDPSMPTETNDGKTVPSDKSTVSAGRVAPTINDAIETFKKARKIAPHAGVVKSVLRLFDELVKCEGGEILRDVRKAVEGIE